MGSREVILERLHKTASSGYTSRDMVKPPKTIEPGSVDMFIEKATAAGARVEKAANTHEVRTKLQNLIGMSGYQSIITSSEKLVKSLDLPLIAQELGIECQECQGMKADTYRTCVLKAEIGITGCDWAIADSGTVVIIHHSSNQRLVSLAPNHYVCIVESGRILSDRFALVSALQGEGPKPPSALTLITGVSRTADVALQVVLGMHGPRTVDIIVVDD